MSVLSFVFVKRLDGRAPPDAPADDLARENASLRADHRAALDAGVITHPDLTTDDTVVLDNRAARNSGLGRDYNAFSDLDVMGDLDEIVDLCSLADPSLAKSSAINA